MGMSIYSPYTIGAIVYGEDENLNTDREDFINELEDLFWDNSTYDVDIAGSEDYSYTLVIRKDSLQSIDWHPELYTANIKDSEEKIKELKLILEANNIQYGTVGIILYPYYSH